MGGGMVSHGGALQVQTPFFHTGPHLRITARGGLSLHLQHLLLTWGPPRVPSATVDLSSLPTSQCRR